MTTTVFDSSALITCCQCVVQGGFVLDHILDFCAMWIPQAVADEVTVGYMRYPDAAIARDRIDGEKILVKEVLLLEGNILDPYKLGQGEKEVLALASNTNLPLVTDDRLAFVVADRLGVQRRLFLDLLVDLVEQKRMQRKLAEEITHAVAFRYGAGFVEHTLRILERGDRKCLM